MVTVDAPYSDLALAYGRGLLVPFLGAGMSTPLCPLWPGFIERLECQCGIARPEGLNDKGENLIRRAAAAIHKLRNIGPNALADNVRSALYGEDTHRSERDARPSTEATLALSEVWWPLVLTTNYDSIFLEAANARWVGRRLSNSPSFMNVLGRSQLDCQRVLNSLRSPDGPILWALQGYLGRANQKHDLGAELVVGHEEYRRETHQAVHFRRAFAEVFRSRTFLFLGAGLQDPYFMELFNEILELLGSVPHMHYALVRRGTVDADFLLKRMQIRLIEYDAKADSEHSQNVCGFLKNLREAIEGPRVRTASWSYRVGATGRVEGNEPPQIQILRSQLPVSLENGECVAISAGEQNDDSLVLGPAGHRVLAHFGIAPHRIYPPTKETGYVHRIAGTSVYVVAARWQKDMGDYRDARSVRPAIEDLLTKSQTDGFTRTNAMLVGAGPKRTFPAYLSLLETLKACRSWYSSQQAAPKLQFRLHVVDPSIIDMISARRIDPLDVLASEEIKFWVECWRTKKDVYRVLEVARFDTTLQAVLAKHDVPSTGWRYSVIPEPAAGEGERTVASLLTELAPRTIDSAGIYLGSTLRLVRDDLAP
jgi:hypothetical protein